jgi:hypothetical protein
MNGRKVFRDYNTYVISTFGLAENSVRRSFANASTCGSLVEKYAFSITESENMKESMRVLCEEMIGCIVSYCDSIHASDIENTAIELPETVCV